MGVRALIACETSQTVTIAMREVGIEAYSCDILPAEGGHPEWHLQQDVLPLLKEQWDLLLGFPPCTHLAVSGARWFEQKKKDGRQQRAIDFFIAVINANSPRIAVENPVNIMSKVFRPPDQRIQPWQFGNPYSKTTCLWLKGLPRLIPTNIVHKGAYITYASGRKVPKWMAEMGESKKRWALRSKTFPGVASAMANQWGKPLLLQTFAK